MSTGYTESHSTTVGYVLWIFGFFGIHRFYYGKPLTGVLWLLTLGLLGIGWIIDFFLIPDMNRDACARYAAGRVDYSATWLLLIFLGPLGIHRFFMGKLPSGILYLLTGGLLGMGVLYDFATLNEQVHEVNLSG